MTSSQSAVAASNSRGRSESAHDFVLCAAGFKGAIFLRQMLARGLRPLRLYTYLQPDDQAHSYEDIVEQARLQGIEVAVTHHPPVRDNELTFVVGWQYLFKNWYSSTVVFHDSLLPRYRGFAPTVTALIKGEQNIGVTAALLESGIDAGPIVAQAATDICYPIQIEEALRIQVGLMCNLISPIVQDWSQGKLKGTAQDNSMASYSLWRDKSDYQIDWTKSAAEIRRFIDAVGYPYEGAKTMADENMLVIQSATEVEDVRFECRDVGKVWQIHDGKPTVVCGAGLLKLSKITDVLGEPYVFKKLRTRLR